MNTGDFSRFDDLVSRSMDDKLSSGESAELAALLSEPALAERFLEMTRLNSEIAGLLSAPVPDGAMVELVRADIEKSLDCGTEAHGGTLPIVQPAQTPSSATPWMTRPTKVSWRRLAWAAAFVLFVGLAAVVFVSRAPVENPRISPVRGEVRLVGANGDRALTGLGSWRPNEELRTVGRNGWATMEFRDGSQLDLDADTVVVNESGWQGRRVRLKRGVIEARFNNSPSNQPIVLVTQQAGVSATSATFRLVAKGTSTRLDVEEGEVRLWRLEDEAEVTVRAGYFAVVALNVPFAATPIAAEPRPIR